MEQLQHLATLGAKRMFVSPAPCGPATTSAWLNRRTCSAKLSRLRLDDLETMVEQDRLELLLVREAPASRQASRDIQSALTTRWITGGQQSFPEPPACKGMGAGIAHETG